MSILPKVRFAVKQRLLKHLRTCATSGLKTRLLIIINLLEKRHPLEVARVLKVHRDTVYRVAKRFREQGEVGLLDRRTDNGPGTLSRSYLNVLDTVVRGSPQTYGYGRPTWTRELLRLILHKQTGVLVHVATLSRALQRIRARRGRPRPTVACPWSNSRKRRRLQRIRQLIEGLPADEVAVYEDEVDIHLNPKIGLDWMGYGQQKEVRTPGQNQKRYLAGALDVRSREVIWVEGERKDSWLFVQLLGELYHHYPKAKRIHVILDNYGIHDSQLVAWALLEAGGRIRLHPLPPYCPEHNKIERVWEDLHAAVTRNHTCPDMEELMGEVRVYLLKRYFRILDQQAEKKPPKQAS
jgi:putative transposase